MGDRDWFANMSRIFSLSTSLRCSLRCGYCASGFDCPVMQKRETIFDEIGVERWLDEVMTLLPNDALVNFHGPAEPTEQAEFADIAERIHMTFGNALRVYTNLLRAERVFDLLDRIAPFYYGCPVEIAASYHIHAYRKGQRESVLESLTALVKRCVPITLMLPATPAALEDPALEDELSELAEAAIPERFAVKVIALGHELDGTPYPASYTEDELVWLALLSARWGAWQKLPRRMSHLRQMGGPLRLEGQPCLYPAVHAAVGIDGRIWNCGPEHEPERRLGAYDGPLYAEGAVPCPHPVCTCKPRGIEYSLRPRGISLEEHYGLVPADEGRDRGTMGPWQR